MMFCRETEIVGRWRYGLISSRQGSNSVAGNADVWGQTSTFETVADWQHLPIWPLQAEHDAPSAGAPRS